MLLRALKRFIERIYWSLFASKGAARSLQEPDGRAAICMVV